MLITLFCLHKTTGDVWDPWRLVFLVLITLFCMHKTTGEVWDPWRQVILVLNGLFCLSSDMWGLGPVETIDSGHNVAVVNAQNHRWGLGPIVTCSSGAKVAVLNAQNVGEVWDPLRLEIPVQKSLFCLQKPKMMAGTHRYYYFWC